AFGLLVRVGACINSPGEAQAGSWLIEGFVPEERLGDDVAAIAGCALRVENRGGLEKAALREALGAKRRSEQQAEDDRSHWRSAWTVNSLSFRGTLYSSFSRRSTVRLLRRRSVISRFRAVQMPCTF